MQLDENIKEFLWQTSKTKVSIEQLVSLAIATPSFVDNLVQISTHTSDRNANWRAAWLLSRIADEEPRLVHPYVPDLVDYCANNYMQCTDAQLRGLLRTLVPLTYSENACGILLDLCSRLFKKQSYAKAVRVNAMIIITNIVLYYTDLKSEFILEFKLLVSHDEKSISAAARKQLKRLENRALISQ